MGYEKSLGIANIANEIRNKIAIITFVEKLSKNLYIVVL